MVNTYEVKITQQAQEQMEEIVDYVSRELFAPEAAKSLLNKLENTIMSLSVFPEKHKLIDEEPWRSDRTIKDHEDTVWRSIILF